MDQGWNAQDQERDSNDVDGNGYADLVGFGDSAVYVSLYQGDVLDGGRGNDTLTGGSGSDIFVFAADDGLDVITDFEVGRDKIEFTTSGLDYSDLTITQSGSNVRINYDDDDRITLNGISLSALNDNNFIFA
jgi:Ca2+-binding RTX toxin-like protein